MIPCEQARGDLGAGLADRFLTPRELRGLTRAEPEWIWSGYLARYAVTLLAGLPKVGKSTLAFAAVEAVRSDSPSFLGRALVGGPCIVLTEEPSFSALAKLGDSDDVRVLVRENASPLPPWPEPVSVAVAEAKRLGAALLVIDSLPFWAQLAADAENDAGATVRAFAPLHEAAASGLAVLVLLHQRKSGGEGGTAIRGSGAIAASADMLLELERVEGSSARHRQLLAVGRWPSPPMLVLDYDPGTSSWRVIGEGAGREEAAGVSWRERVLGVLPNCAPGATLDEIGELLDADRRKWGGALKALIDQTDDVVRVGSGTKGAPFRHYLSEDPVPESRPGDRTESASGAAVSIPSSPYRGTESNTAPNGKASSPGADQDVLDADAELERIAAKFGPPGRNSAGELMPF